MSTIELRGGLLVREDAIVLALTLEAHSHALSVKDGALLVSNGSTLTVEERASIVALKRHLMAIAAYVAPTVEPC